MSERWLSDSASKTAGPATADQETIALLEEEIARLEDEIRIRDHASSALSLEKHTDRGSLAHNEAAEERIAQLGIELATREETIALLLEQTRLADEAEAASRAEWEQLHNWVQEVERRVADQTDPGTELHQLADERRSNEILRQAAEKQERSWEVQRQSLIAEVERLRSRFTEVAGGSDTTVAAVQALEFENRELRDAYDSLARTTVPQHEMEAIVAELQVERQQHATIVQDLNRHQDDRQRERNEYEANLNALRSQLARDSLRRQEEQIKSTVAAPASKESLLEADMRIRAFREHLKEIHHDETEQRMRRSLAARLSRLWNHTSAKS